MKKRFLLSVLLATSVAAMAQNVGIGTTSPSDQLHTTGTVRFQNYSGNSNRILLVDSAGRLKTAGSGAIFRSDATNSNLGIPDNGCSNGVFAISYINVTGVTATSNTKIAVKVNITHAYVGDLSLFLVNPSGQTITLTSVNSNNSGDNFRNTIFTDGASAFPGSSSAAAPFAGVYAPQGLGGSCSGSYNSTIANFAAYGTSLNGGWALVAFDKAAGDIGTLDNWQITFDGEQALQQETNLGGNFSITAGNAAGGKVLTAIDNSGHTEWKFPSQYNTGFSAEFSSTQTVASSFTINQVLPFAITTSPIFNPKSFDDGGNFNSSLNYYTAPADGVYQFNAFLGMANAVATNNGIVVIRILVNGVIQGSQYTQATASEPFPTSYSVSATRKLHKGDQVSLAVFNNTGTALSFNGASCNFSGFRVY